MVIYEPLGSMKGVNFLDQLSDH